MSPIDYSENHKVSDERTGRKKLFTLNKMTKFILHGGSTSKDLPSNDAFFEEMAQGEEPVKILLTYFARPKEQWEKCLRQDTERLFLISFGKELEIELAEDNKEVFIEQIQESNVIYMRGGREMKLLEIFQSIENIEDLLQGKTVAGSSMGVYILSKYFRSNSSNDIWEGTGILPIKAFCHYDNSRKKELQELKDFGEQLPTYTLRDGEYIIVDAQGNKL